MVRALGKLAVTGAAMGTCDCQTCADDGRRRGSLCCQHSSASAEGRRWYPSGTGTDRVSCAPLAPGDGESAALTDRDTDTAVLLCLVLASGRHEPTLLEKAPLWAAPSPCPWGSEWLEPASGPACWPSHQKWGAGSGTGTSQTCTGGGAA